MTRIRLVVTGDVEEIALADALKQLFPQLEFSTVKKDAGNSQRLSSPPVRARREFNQFVDEMLACGLVERVPGGKPFDYVIVIDDLELANADQPNVTLGHLRLAVESRLTEIPKEVPAILIGKNKNWPYLNDDSGRRRYLQERCSYHLLSPMVESLFFGECGQNNRDALMRAGATCKPIFDASTVDIERFETTDTRFIGFSGSATWTSGKAADPNWRSKHPKHYVTFLCDPEGKQWKPYKEKAGGRAALEALDWQSVVAPPAHACFVRAMLEDIAAMVGVQIPWLAQGALHPLTRRKSNGILRNISR